MKATVLVLAFLLASSPLVAIVRSDGTLPGLGNPLPFLADVLGGLGHVAAVLAQEAWEAIGYLASFSWLVGNAKAADRYLVAADPGCTVTAVATDAGCWAASSGGAGGAGVPGVGDNAFLDSNSGTAAVTQDTAMSVANFYMTSGAGDYTGNWSTASYSFTIGGTWDLHGTFNAGGSGIIVKDFQAIALGVMVFNYGTSNIIFSNGGSFDTPTVSFYDVTITGSVNQLSNEARVRHALDLQALASLTIPSNEILYLENAYGINDVLIMGVGAQIIGAAGYAILTWQMAAGTMVHVPGGDYPGIDMNFRSTTSVSGDGYEFRLTGDVNAWGFVLEPLLSDKLFINSQTYNVTLAGKILDAPQFSPPTQHGIKATSGTWTINGEFNVSRTNSTTFYMQLGSSFWRMASNYINNVTTNAANWSAGTSTVQFGTVYPFIGQDIYPACQLGIQEFDHVLVETRENRTGTIVKLHGCIRATTVTVQTGPHVPFLNTTLNLTTGSIYTQNFSVLRDANWEGWHGSIYTCDWYTMQGFVESPRNSTVHFTCSGRVLPNGRYYDYNFYNVIVDAGVTSTWSWMRQTGVDGIGEPICDATYGNYSIVGIWNQLTVNGKILSGAPLGCFIYPTFLIQSRDTQWPLLLGPSANISSQGVVTVIEIKSTYITQFYLPAITAYHLSVLEETHHPWLVRIDMTGNIRTVDCIGLAHSPGSFGHVHEAYCAILLSHEQPSGPPLPGNYALYSHDYSIEAGGSLWIGDFFGYGVIFHGGNSVLAGRPFSVIGGATAYLNHATVYGYPGTIWTAQAFLLEYYGTLYAGTSVFHICGSWTTWATNRIFPGVIPPYLQKLYAQNSTWYIRRDCALSDPHPPHGNPWHAGGPGDVVLMQDSDYIDMGGSTWYVDGNWTSVSTSPLWNVGSSKVYFTGNRTVFINGTAVISTGAWVKGGTNNKFNKVYFLGTGPYIVQDPFSTGDVHEGANATWTLSPGVVYTVLPGSTLFLDGVSEWSGNATAYVTMTSSGAWFIVMSGYVGAGAPPIFAASYIQVDNSSTNWPHSIQACDHGADGGGNNPGWLFPTGAYCMSLQFQPILIQMAVILFMSMGVIIAVGIILTSVKRIGKAGGKDD